MRLVRSERGVGYEIEEDDDLYAAKVLELAILCNRVFFSNSMTGQEVNLRS